MYYRSRGMSTRRYATLGDTHTPHRWPGRLTGFSPAAAPSRHNHERTPFYCPAPRESLFSCPGDAGPACAAVFLLFDEYAAPLGQPPDDSGVDFIAQKVDEVVRRYDSCTALRTVYNDLFRLVIMVLNRQVISRVGFSVGAT